MRRPRADREIPEDLKFENAPPLVKEMEAALKKFVPIGRLKNDLRRDVTVIRHGWRLFILLKRGRWTATPGSSRAETHYSLESELDGFLFSNGRRNYGNVYGVFKSLIGLGAISPEMVTATKEWLEKRANATSRKDEIDRLAEHAAKLGYEIVPTEKPPKSS